MAMSRILPLITETELYKTINDYTDLNTFEVYKKDAETQFIAFLQNDFNPIKEAVKDFDKYKATTKRAIEDITLVTNKSLANTEESKEYAKRAAEHLQNESEYLKSRETFVENFVSQVNSNVKIMQAYVERQLLEARIEQEITQKQLTELLTLPWYKRFTKRQRNKVLERVRNEVLEEYKELKEQAEKKINNALVEGNVVIKQIEGNNDGQSDV